MLALATDAGLLDINATFWIEIAAFLLMLLLLGRYAYPRILAAAEQRQQQIQAQLEGAEQARVQAEEQLAQAAAQLEEARNQAQEVIAGARRAADEIRQEAKGLAAEEAARIAERAQQDIEAAREQAIRSVQGEIADLVVLATQKVVFESLDDRRHRQLIQQAIDDVTSSVELGARGAQDGRQDGRGR